jgi:nucleoid-associated protein YgaU
LAASLFPNSYRNNPYQREANRYTILAQRAFDEGEYGLATEYSAEAVKNAELSEAYIAKALARAEALRDMNAARSRLKWAERIGAVRNWPDAVAAAEQAITAGTSAFEQEDFPLTSEYAQQALAALMDVREITPLPKFYTVHLYSQTGDCYWNISANPAVYNNPLIWRNLYEANRSRMKNPNNPDLILPGMVIEIPSIRGEYREGMYNPLTKYENTLSANR